ncbi:MAG: class I poly(R)-hydroxyalkanoic acid synthase [Paracoccaceae bacterium]|nr:class I poly(R)-hydroxyalkanoic acid synthase [Paracoccaceae bacterium]
MTTKDTTPLPETPEIDKFAQNLAKIEALSARLTSALVNKKPHDAALDGPSQDVYVKAATAMMAEIVQNPTKLLEMQISYWGESLKHYVEAQAAFAGGALPAPTDAPKDKRFQNPLWATNPYFNLVKKQYLLSSEAIENTVNNIETLEENDHTRLRYFVKQIVDLVAPTNFLATNPDALERALETQGASLVQGLENLVRDVEANEGELLVSLADPEPFVLGQNIATAKGGVVFRNRMFELLQYHPTTEQVHETPLLIFPPWINKFYVLDLKPQNSLIQWVVDQGFSVFVVSWVNPDASYADVGLEDYVREGYITAMAEVRKITGEAQINTVGYCIAGTTLALTTAYLRKQNDASIKSATLFTTLTDFSDKGEFEVFLSDDFVDGIERQARNDGVLKKAFMSRTFSFLRSNDLIYRPAIKSYMMGEKPPAFDLLYWNEDGTNLPAKMAVEYLRGLCQSDLLSQGQLELFGTMPSLADIDVPVFSVACETDHIAAWRSAYQGLTQFGSSDKTFVLSQSGHIAGIVNPPSKNKYGHYINDAPISTPDAFLDGAQFHAQSWWPTWAAWLAKRSGSMISARQISDSGREILAQAPGEYVRKKANY